MSDWGMIDKIHEAGAVVKRDQYVFRWSDGHQISSRPGKDWVQISIEGKGLLRLESDLTSVVGSFKIRASVAVSDGLA